MRAGEKIGPPEGDVNSALQCRVSLLLNKVNKHQRVLFLYLFTSKEWGFFFFLVVSPKAVQTFVAKMID